MTGWKVALSALVIGFAAAVAGMSGSAVGAEVVAQEVPGWQQVNSNGFGDHQTV